MFKKKIKSYLLEIHRKVIIAGGSGLIGRYLTYHLYDHGYKVFIISRNVSKAQSTFGNVAKVISWEDFEQKNMPDLFAEKYSIVNLTGENISSGRWTKNFKKIILQSRLLPAKKIINVINSAENKPEVFIQASAIGYYNNKGLVAEETSDKGDGFLSNVVYQIENYVSENLTNNIRLCYIRTGIVLSTDGGILKKLLPLFKFYLGARMGSGNQWRSWIHYYDEVRAIKHLLENIESKGVYNLVSPKPVTEKVFVAELAKVLKKPAFFNIPSFVLNLIFGEMANTILLNGENVVPDKLLKEGFRFEYEHLSAAFHNLLCE